MKVFAPNKQYTGMSASVPFCNGVGETEDPRLLNWFRNHGYEVEESTAEVQEELKAENSAPEENLESDSAKKGKAASQKVGE